MTSPVTELATVRTLARRQMSATPVERNRNRLRAANPIRLLTFGVGECGLCGGRLKLVTDINSRGRRHFDYVCARFGCVRRDARKVNDLVRNVVLAATAAQVDDDELDNDELIDANAPQSVDNHRARSSARDWARMSIAERRVLLDQIKISVVLERLRTGEPGFDPETVRIGWVDSPRRD